MSLYVNPILDPGQRIRRVFTFYELVELTTFGKLFFDRPDRLSGHGQSWWLVDDNDATDVLECGSDAVIVVESSVQGLARSFLVGDDVDVVLAPSDAPGVSAAARRRAAGDASGERELMVVLRARCRARGEPQPALQSLSIDLKSLLERVMVPPAASTRFLRVVADLVQRITNAPVFRAST